MVTCNFDRCYVLAIAASILALVPIATTVSAFAQSATSEQMLASSSPGPAGPRSGYINADSVGYVSVRPDQGRPPVVDPTGPITPASPRPPVVDPTGPGQPRPPVTDPTRPITPPNLTRPAMPGSPQAPVTDPTRPVPSPR